MPIEATFDSGEIPACEEAGITVTLPKPMTSGAKAEGRFGKQDFVYVAEDDVYLRPADERLTYRYTNEEEGKTLRRYRTTAYLTCALKPKCTTGRECRISRWSMSMSLRPASAGSTNIRGRCGSGAKPSNIRSVRAANTCDTARPRSANTST